MAAGGPESDARRIREGLRDRRAFLATLYGATLGALVAACGVDDADVFAADGGANGSAVSTDRTLRVQTGESNTTAAGTASSDGSTGSSQTTSDNTTSSAPPSSSSTTEVTSAPTTASSQTTSGGSGGALPAGGTMVVAFTYEQVSGGKNVPPYVAVWIEDGSGNLATTVALWYQQFGRGERWLPDLTRWYNVDQSRIAGGGADTVDAISGPTRPPGSFQVAWDGRINGSTAPAGSYFVCIESARERGPYSLIRQSVNLNGSTQQQSLSSDGELVNASMAVNP